jgi:DNA-binding response OmpR family regulator
MKPEPEICPACNQPIVPEGLQLPPTKARILAIVRRHPNISAEELRTAVWADDPSGGPEDRKVLHVHVAQLNKLLEPHGLMVRSQGGGYRVRSAA